MKSYLSDLNQTVHLSVAVVLHGLRAGATLAGGGDGVTPPAAPGHGQVTVVRQLRDPLAAQPQRNMKT